jgi:choline monooxygenase
MQTFVQYPDLTDYNPAGTLATAETMPSRWYTDPAFLELEKRKIFWKTWQPVGRADMVARPGDYFTCEVVGEPLVVTRGVDGALKAFFNVGVQNWDKGAVCLKPVRVVEWGPFIFVNLDDSAPDFMEVYGSIDAEIRQKGIDISRMRAMERRDYYIDCNWKVYVDNYLEGYHVPIAHPGLYRELDYEQYRVDTFRYYSSQYAPIRPSKEGEIQGRDRRYVRTEAEAEALYYWIFPNTMLNIYPDNMSINIILPVGHDKTLTIFEWYFEEPGTGDGWESMQQTIAFSDEIQQEDIEICVTVQKGLQSRAYDRGRFSVKRENGVHHFQSLVHEFLIK